MRIFSAICAKCALLVRFRINTSREHDEVLARFWLGCLLVGMVCLPALAQSPDAGYQAGKIVNVERLPGTGGGVGGTDAQANPDVATYKISVQVNDTIYVVRHQAQGALDQSWIQGKDVQVRVAGKKMYIKRASGKDSKGSILSTTKVSTP